MLPLKSVEKQSEHAYIKINIEDRFIPNEVYETLLMVLQDRSIPDFNNRKILPIKVIIIIKLLIKFITFHIFLILNLT